MPKGGIRARRKRRNHILLGTGLLGLVAVFVGWVIWALWTRELPADKTTLCPASGPRGHYVLLVDKTDPLTFLQKEAFGVVVEELIQRRLPEGYLLSVFALGPDFQSTARPLIERCNPGSGADKGELLHNPQRLKRLHQEQFIAPMKQEVEKLIGFKSASQSPIFEMMQLVSVNAFRKHAVNGERRLIVMSDMLHNTPQFSMYRTDVEFSSFSASDYGRRTQLDLANVQVELHYLMNAPKFQTRRQLKFWEEYFDKAGARVVAVQPLGN